ncbi:MAG: LPS export ABC transporter permease LptG [Rhodoferax sp.]
MKTLRRFLYGEVAGAVALVTLGFIALFFFFDFVEELQNVTRHGQLGYQIPQALVYVALMAPSHVYELLPITVLIGTIFVMARLAQSSEFTILRTSGLGPWRALRALGLLGLFFTVFTFAVGDYLAPFADRTAQRLRANYLGKLTVGKTGAWLKDRQPYAHFAVNVGSLSADAQMRDVHLFEYDNRGFMVSITRAQSAQFSEGEAWLLQSVQRTDFPAADAPQPGITLSTIDTLRWPTRLSAEMVAAAVLKPERMGTLALFQYMQHLKGNGQSAQKYEIQFWKKVFYPLSCLVMVVLALPFAYFHFRSGSIAPYVFVGVMAGISFVLLNNVLNDLGNLRGWQPWLTAAVPGLVYSLFSLSAFSWLVVRR